jgi:type II secretory pathway pseudopilin PulG
MNSPEKFSTALAVVRPAAHRRRRRAGRSGITLLELLAAMIILSFIVILLASIFRSSSDLMVRNANRIEINQVVRAVLQQISSDLEQTIYLNPNVVTIYSPNVGVSVAGIPSQTLYLIAYEPPSLNPNPLNNVVNVGYTIGVTNVAPPSMPILNKFVLQRGDDFLVNPTTNSNNWWLASNFSSYQNNDNYTNTTYWKTLSDNVIGISFAFYTNAASANLNDSVSTWTNAYLPYRVGVTIWAIDAVSYSRAVNADSGLTNAMAIGIITNNVRRYSTQVFLPRSTD